MHSRYPPRINTHTHTHTCPFTKAHEQVFTPKDGVFCEVELHLGHIPEEHYVAIPPSSDRAQTEIKRNERH